MLARSPFIAAAGVAVALVPLLLTSVAAQDKIYWTGSWANSIQRANLADGSNLEEVVTEGASWPWGIAVDPVHCWVYWGDIGTKVIKRARLNGTDVQKFVATGVKFGAKALWASLADDMLYWTEQDSRVKRTSLSGNGVIIEELVNQDSGVFGDWEGLAVDSSSSPVKVYVADMENAWAIRSQTWGTAVMKSAIGEGTSVLGQAIGLALDPSGHKIYWADSFLKTIQSATLGSNGDISAESVVSNLDYPLGVTVTADHVYFTDLGAGGHKVVQVGLDGSPGWSVTLQGTPKPMALAILNGTLAQANGCVV